MKTVEVYRGVNAIEARSAMVWRKWLEKNYDKETSVWLIIYKKQSGYPSVYYSEAVDEALCYGWVDSKVNKRDDHSYYQYFAKRDPKSNWSKVNKDKVERLLAARKLAPPGLAMIELAKEKGTWNALDQVDALVIPPDMMSLFSENKTALMNWEKFPRSAKRGILEWIMTAKKAETRQKRIKEAIGKAGQNIKVLFDT